VVRKGLLLITLLAVAGCGGSASTSKNYMESSVNVAVRSGTYLNEDNHSAWGKADCLGCHQNFKHSIATFDLSREDYQSIIDAAVSKVGAKNSIEVCSACHGTNGVSEVRRRCLICHDSMDKLHFYAGAEGKSSPHDFDGNGLDDGDCLVCHWQPDMDGVLEPDTDLARFGGACYSVNDLCLSCHRNFPLNAGRDLNGDGKADESVDVSLAPDINTPYSSDYHGGGITSANASFDENTLSGMLLYPDNGLDAIYKGSNPLLCIQCHNPHHSSNDRLIVERAGETLAVESIVQQVDGNYSSSKVAVIDPVSGEQFGFSYSTEETDLGNFTSKIILNSDANETANRQTLNSLCAACHGGSYTSNVNGLNLPVDISDHYSGNCTDCHTHGGTF